MLAHYGANSTKAFSILSAHGVTQTGVCDKVRPRFLDDTPRVSNTETSAGNSASYVCSSNSADNSNSTDNSHSAVFTHELVFNSSGSNSSTSISTEPPAFDCGTT